MKEENNKTLKKNGSKFNVIDALIIVLVLAAIVGIAMRYDFIGDIGVNQNLSDYEIAFSVSDIRYTSSDAFVEGDTVRLTSDGTYIGKMMDLTSILPASAYATDAEGNIIHINYPESTRIDVTGRISCQGVKTASGILAGDGVSLVPGMSIAVSTEHLDVVLTVVSLTLGAAS